MLFPPKKAKKLLSCVSILTGYGNLPDKLIRHWTTPASPSFDVSPPPTTCSSKIIREVKIKQKIVKKFQKCLPRPRQSGCYVKLGAHITANLTSCVVRRHIQTWTTLCLSFKRVVFAGTLKLLIEPWLVNTHNSQGKICCSLVVEAVVCKGNSSELGSNHPS